MALRRADHTIVTPEDSSPASAAARHQRAAELFDRAIDLPEDRRQPFLDAACGGDSDLRRRVMALLAAAAKSGVTVVMVTHSLVHAAEAERTIKLLDGRVVSETLLAA